MRLWKKILLALFVALLLSQAPFLYRRYKLGRLHQSILALNAQRTPIPDDEYTEYVGVAHVHSFLGGHSTGTFQQIIAAAHANRLNFVLMTEHPAREFDSSALTLKGQYEGLLFVNGSEVGTVSGDRLLIFPGDAEAYQDAQRATAEVLKARAGIATFVAYPESFKSWEATGYRGIEVYNTYTDAQRANKLLLTLDGLWAYRSYPDLLFANIYRRPAGNLALWDQAIARTGGPVVAIAGNDAHANVGINLSDAAGHTLFGLKLDPYERSFRLVRLHVLLPDSVPLTTESLLSAIGRGSCYIGYDLFGDTSGFRFRAQSGAEQRVMGEEISLAGEVTLTASVPVNARIVLLKDGTVIKEELSRNRLEFVTKEKGSYRVEIYLASLPPPVSEVPWIISNPIYLR
jgi:hypothetical protein